MLHMLHSGTMSVCAVDTNARGGAGALMHSEPARSEGMVAAGGELGCTP